MANTFISNIAVGTGTSEVTLYTAPASTTATIIGLSSANKLTSNVSVSVVLQKSGGTRAFLVKSGPVSVGGTIVLCGGNQKIVLQAGDSIRISASVASSIDSVISVLELS